MNDYERLQEELLNIRNSAQAARRIMFGMLSDSDLDTAEQIGHLANNLLARVRRKAREQSLSGLDGIDKHG